MTSSIPTTPNTTTIGSANVPPVMAIAAAGLVAGYRGVPVVHDIELHVAPGEVVALLGSNGAGKTTLLLALSGELPLITGEVWIGGTKSNAPLYKRARAGLAFVTEERSIFKSLSTADNLKVGSCNPDDALNHFPELKKRMQVPAGLLSGGEQQMLTLARAIARKPKILLVDELSLGLAPLVTQRLFEILRETASETGMAVLLVEQHIRKALSIADRGYVLNQGRLVLSGTGTELIERVNEIEESYFTLSLK